MAAICPTCVKGGHDVQEVKLEIECLFSAGILARGNDVAAAVQAPFISTLDSELFT
jgi:hypothetical protein